MREMTAEECADMKQFTKAQYKTAEVSADEIVSKLEDLRGKFWSQLPDAFRFEMGDLLQELLKCKGTFSLRASGTPLAGILKEGIQRMTDLMAEYAEAGELDRPFIRACDDWLTKTRALLASAPTLSEAGAPLAEQWADWIVHRHNFCEREAGESLKEIAVYALKQFSKMLAAPEAGAKEGNNK